MIKWEFVRCVLSTCTYNSISNSYFVFPLGNTLELTITHVDNSSYLSFLDQTIDKFNYWLRRLFRREPYSSSNSSINDISSIQSPRDSSNNAHIVMTDEDSFGEGSSVPVASGSFRPQGRVTSVLQSYFVSTCTSYFKCQYQCS